MNFFKNLSQVIIDQEWIKSIIVHFFTHHEYFKILEGFSHQIFILLFYYYFKFVK
jgi:hypothetical protein